jgi:FAD/FMN-containing dehydrogenase
LLIQALRHRLNEIEKRRQGNERVGKLLVLSNGAVDAFEAGFAETERLRRDILHKLLPHTRRDNIAFDGMARVSHVTDATDWRVEYPFVVLHPDTEQEIPALVAGCIALGLTVIPRGGGTGYTGGAIPLTRMSAVINTEKLDHMSVIEPRVLPGHSAGHRDATPVIVCGAGVVTRRVMEAAEAQRSGVRGGSDQRRRVLHRRQCVDERRRQEGGAVGHRARQPGVVEDGDAGCRLAGSHSAGSQPGKIHDVDMARFELRRFACRRQAEGRAGDLQIPGSAFRKQGLGKDVTDKFLSGLPGIQKEGCDGLITQATFVLHRMPPHIRTVCMEFFGPVGDAVPAIVEVKNHMDTAVPAASSWPAWNTWTRAISRRWVMPPRPIASARPNMVLLADIAGDDADSADAAAAHIVELARARGGEGFIAVSPEARKKFWLDRSRTAAIAKHTNAFKVNEDVVIPLPRLGDYSDGVERINIELSINNKLRCCRRWPISFRANCRCSRTKTASPTRP